MEYECVLGLGTSAGTGPVRLQGVLQAQHNRCALSAHLLLFWANFGS